MINEGKEFHNIINYEIIKLYQGEYSNELELMLEGE